jgi:hypothetical protein
MLFLLLITATIGAASVPECRWACDDPTCNATCSAVCDAPRCEIQCTIGAPAQCGAPRCNTRCADAATQDISSTCPECETICPGGTLDCPVGHSCEIVCEAPICNWSCRKPTNCPYPRCELQCERPACSGAPKGQIVGASVLLLITLLIL